MLRKRPWVARGNRFWEVNTFHATKVSGFWSKFFSVCYSMLVGIMTRRRVQEQVVVERLAWWVTVMPSHWKCFHSHVFRILPTSTAYSVKVECEGDTFASSFFWSLQRSHHYTENSTKIWIFFNCSILFLICQSLSHLHYKGCQTRRWYGICYVGSTR